MSMNKRQAENFAKTLGLDPVKYTLLDIGDGMYTFSKPILLNRETASNWLEKFNLENRSPKPNSHERMANDIREDYWHVTHQGIAFRGDGSEEKSVNGLVLGDGQNRLQAIVRADKATKVRIFLGLTKNAMLAIDGNAPRTNLDTLTLQGVQNLSSKRLSSLKFFLGGRKGAAKTLSAEALQTLLVKWQDELEYCFTAIPSATPFITAAVRGVIMRAYRIHKNDPVVLEKLKRFCDQLATGLNITSPVMKDFKEALRGQKYGGEGRKVVYAYTEDVLHHFLSYRPNGKKEKYKPSKVEIFALAEVKPLGEAV